MAEEYQIVELTSKEDEIFEAEWDKFITRHTKVREVVDVYQDHKDWIKEACRIAKYQLEAPFGGINAKTNEFGWMPILPNFLLATSTPTYATATWVQYITTTNVTTRWIDWIGTSSSNLKLSKYGTLITIGFHDPVEVPKIDGLLAKVKGTDYPIWYFGEAMEETDYHVYELTDPIIVEKEQEFYIQELCGRAGVTKIRPIGVYYAKGDHMRDKNAYAKV